LDDEPRRGPQTDTGRDEETAPAAIDVRDTFGNTGPAVGDATTEGAVDVREPEAGPYPLPELVERPHVPETHATAPVQPTRDPSLSRAVDRAAAGLAPESAGYDRSIEGPPPGPLEPPVDEEHPASEGKPGGQWGSSG
jgi:hypothetical protein